MATATDLGRRSPTCAAAWHGTISAYKYGCRCPHAREHKRITEKRRREGRYRSTAVPGIGTARRIQGLVVQQFRFTDLAAELGCSFAYVQNLASRGDRLVYQATADKVRALAHRLADRRGPSPIAAKRARTRGWVSLAEWADIDNPNCRPYRRLVNRRTAADAEVAA
jgi:hypothetical protein